MASSHGDGPEAGLGLLWQHDDPCNGSSEGEDSGDPERRDVALAEQLVPRPRADSDDHLRHHDGDVEDTRAQPCTYSNRDTS